MPTYGYQCQSCQKEMEFFQKITDLPLKSCPECGADALTRLPGGGIGLSFKGSGFYITDYGDKKPKEAKEAKETKKPETKTTDAQKCPCGSQTKCSK